MALDGNDIRSEPQYTQAECDIMARQLLLASFFAVAALAVQRFNIEIILKPEEQSPQPASETAKVELDYEFHTAALNVCVFDSGQLNSILTQRLPDGRTILQFQQYTLCETTHGPIEICSTGRAGLGGGGQEAHQ